MVDRRGGDGGMSEDSGVVDGWRKSSTSTTSECVEVQVGADYVHVRDSKNDGGPVLTFTYSEWRAFLAGVQDGEFELPERCSS